MDRERLHELDALASDARIDARARERLFARLRPEVLRLLQGDEDQAQDVLLVVHRKLDQAGPLSGGASLRWVRRVTRYVRFEAARTKRRSKLMFGEDEWLERVPAVESASPSRLVDLRRLLDSVLRRITAMTTVLREALRRVAMEESPPPGKSAGTERIHRRVGRKRLARKRRRVLAILNTQTP